ncbi:glycoprotein-polysaccharide metabolism [Klebsiella pneumoniae]|uniref:Glycoprotein-polysaccharide metabolism n=1 Tax=Klebsiella pneumoniae TaxID=573 RepID=A0A4P0XXG0_KLEPN|nr:glycoprotein-polysaccharide metabolism [Klebsiella pneumoniae]
MTLSDASLADAPARVLSQKAVRTEGKQAPFNFALPYNPADIQPNARILLSAAITVNGQLMFITDTVQTVINQGGTHADLTLVPVQQTAVPVAPVSSLRPGWGLFFLPSINPAIMLEIDMAAAGDLHTLGQQRLTLPL